jgi:hypothetical protein
MLPPGLLVKLDTYHADLANAIEAKTDSQKAASDVPDAGSENTDVREEGNTNALYRGQPAQ